MFNDHITAWDVNITMHHYICRYVIHGGMLLSLSMAICYPWRYGIHGEMLSMARCYPWRDVIHDEMVSMARWYP